jgi:hypothetical protein
VREKCEKEEEEEENGKKSFKKMFILFRELKIRGD